MTYFFIRRHRHSVDAIAFLIRLAFFFVGRYAVLLYLNIVLCVQPQNKALWKVRRTKGTHHLIT